MEIVKIGEETWQNAVFHQSFFTTNVFYCTVANCYIKIDTCGNNMSAIIEMSKCITTKIKSQKIYLKRNLFLKIFQPSEVFSCVIVITT